MSALALRPAPALAPARTPSLAPGTLAGLPDAPARQAPLDLAFGRSARPRTAPAGPPVPGPTAQHLVQAVLEVIEGQRSPVALQRSVSPEVLQHLVRRAAARRTAGTPRPRPVIRRLRVTCPSPGTCEAAAVVVLSGTVRAVAVRLRTRGDRWVLDALELG